MGLAERAREKGLPLLAPVLQNLGTALRKTVDTDVKVKS